MIDKPEPEYLATLTERTQRYIRDLEAEVAELVDHALDVRSAWGADTAAWAKRIAELEAIIAKAADVLKQQGKGGAK